MTSTKTSSVDIATISDDQSLTDYELVERMHKIEEKRQALEKQREREELRKDPDIRKKQYRAAHFICHPRCGFVADRRDEGAIIEHKSQCGYCIEARQEREAQKQAWVDALAEMRGILFKIEEAKQTIENQKRKIEREKKEKLLNYEVVVGMAEYKIKEAESVIAKEQINKHKMLNPDLNNLPATISEAVRDMYLQYERLSPEKKKRFENYISYKSFSE